MAKSLRLILFSIFLPLVSNSIPEECIQKNECVCEFNDLARIDLSELLKGLPNTTSFPLQSYHAGLIYGFNGCHDKEVDVFNPKDNTTQRIKAALIAQHNETFIDKNNKTTSYTVTAILGTAKQIVFNKGNLPGDFEIIFKDGSQVTAIIRLLCDDITEPFIKVLQNTSNTQNLVLSSPHACIKIDHPGLSTGSTLIILLIIGLMIYFIGGGLIMYFMRGARGIEIIPNIDFWRELPGLVKDGAVFLMNGCNANAISAVDSYDRI